MKLRRGKTQVAGVFFEFQLPGSSPREQLNLGLAFLEWGPSSRLLCADIAEHAQARFAPHDPRKEKAIVAALKALRLAIKDYLEDPSHEIWHYLGTRNAYGLALKTDNVRDEWGNLILDDPTSAERDANSALESAAQIAAWYPWDTSYNALQSADRSGDLDNEIDWQLNRLLDYLQFEAQEALIASRSDARDLPEIKGDPKIIGLALIIRESAAKLLDITKVRNKKERAQKQKWLDNLKEKTSAAYWMRLHAIATEVREDTQGWSRSFPWKKRTLLVAMDEVDESKEKIEGLPMRTKENIKGLPSGVGRKARPKRPKKNQGEVKGLALVGGAWRPLKASKEQVEEALREAGWRGTVAAKSLGISESSFRDLMSRYQIEITTQQKEHARKLSDQSRAKGWANKTPEQREEHGQRLSEMRKEQWDRLSDTEKEERSRAKSEARKAWLASLTEEERAEYSRAASEGVKKHLASLTEKEKTELSRAKSEGQRAWLASLTEEERAEYSRAASEGAKKRLASLTDEERAELYRMASDGQKRWLASLTDKEREALNRANSEQKKEWWANAPPDVLALRSKMSSEQFYAQDIETQRRMLAAMFAKGKKPQIGSYQPAASRVGAGPAPKASDQQRITSAINHDQRARGGKGSIAVKRAKVGAYLPEIETPGSNLNSKLTAGTFVLSARSARRFGADCAEHVLPLWEYQYPRDRRPHDAIAAARKCREFSKQANIISNSTDPMIEAGSKAFLASQEIERDSSFSAQVARAAAHACSTPVGRFWPYQSPMWERHSAQMAWLTAQWGWGYSIGYHLTDIPDDNTEAAWQYEKLKEYLQLDAQDAMLRDHGEGLYPLSGKPEYIAFGTLVRRQVLEMLQLLRKRTNLSDKHQRLIVDCANELSARDDAEYWAQGRDAAFKRQRTIDTNVTYNVSAMEALIDESVYLDPSKVLKSWGPYKPSPKRPKKGSVSGIQLWQGAGLRALSVVGAMEPWEDPSTSPQVLESLIKNEPRALLNPNMPLTALVRCASIFPWYVEHNPVLPMMSLEEPAVYEKLRNALCTGWRQAGLVHLTDKDLRSLAVDCAEHVIYVYERKYYTDKRLRDVIHVVRRFVNGRATEDELVKATSIAAGCARSAADYQSGSVAQAVMFASDPRTTPRLYYADKAMECAVNSVYSIDWDQNRKDQELGYQADRIRFYYAKNHPEYRIPTKVGGIPEWNDAQGEPLALAELAKSQPRTLTNPNLPWDVLIEGAKKHPWFVESNPVLGLLQLEDPAFYRKLSLAILTGWRSAGVKTLSPLHKVLYATDCAGRALPQFETRNPEDLRPQRLLSLSRRYAEGQTTREKLGAAVKAVDEIDINSLHIKAGNAVASIFCSASAALKEGVYPAIEASTFALASSPDPDAERRWQADRVRYYYQLENSDYQMPEIIGGKKKWDDPQQDPQVLAKMAPRNPRTYSNPNLPWESLVEGARKHPIIVEKNPALGLLSLEDPARYRQIQNAINDGWTDKLAQALSPQHQRLLAADCAEHVLPYIQASPQLYPYAEVAVAVARRYANGEASEDELVLARKAARQMADKLKTFSPGSYASYAAAQACEKELKGLNLWRGQYAAAHAFAPSASPEWVEGMRQEQSWQADRVRYYYAKEHPEYQSPDVIGRARRTAKKRSRK